MLPTSWIEKYRPVKINEIITQDTEFFNNIVATKSMPHLLIYGNPGIGKTSSILCLCNELYSPRMIKSCVLELNASDERGINVVRDKIIWFAKITLPTKDPKFPSPDFKIIILDEADAMTKEAQSALRRVMEETTNITRFVFICNNVHKITEPLQSRCVKIKFKDIEKNNCIEKLQFIAENENLNINIDSLETISTLCNGDLRKSILFLQNIKFIKTHITDLTPEKIYNIFKHITQNELNNYIENIKNAEDALNTTISVLKNGYVINSVLIESLNYILNLEMDDIKKSNLIFTIGELEYILNDGGSEFIVLLKLFSLFIGIKE